MPIFVFQHPPIPGHMILCHMFATADDALDWLKASAAPGEWTMVAAGADVKKFAVPARDIRQV